MAVSVHWYWGHCFPVSLSFYCTQQTKISVACNRICSSLPHYMLTGAQLDLPPGHASCLVLLHMAHIFLGQWDTLCMHIPGTCQAFAVFMPTNRPLATASHRAKLQVKRLGNTLFLPRDHSKQLKVQCYYKGI